MKKTKKHEKLHQDFTLVKKIKKILKETPNDQELGVKVRKLINKHEKEVKINLADSKTFRTFVL